MASHQVMWGLRGLACVCGWAPALPNSYIDDDGELVMPTQLSYTERINAIHTHINEELM